MGTEADEAPGDPAGDRPRGKVECLADRLVALVAREEAVEDLPAVLGRGGESLVNCQGLVEQREGLVGIAGGELLIGDGALARRFPEPVDAQAPDDARITLFRNGVAVAAAQGARLQHETDAAVYRVEVTLPGSPGNPPVPWIVSNPIYVGREPQESPPQVTEIPKARTFTTLYSGGPARGWTIEKSAASDAAIDVIGAITGSQVLLRFAMSGTTADSPYAAFVMPAPPAMASSDRLVFTAREDRTMRVSVQLREPGEEGERWRRYRQGRTGQIGPR